MLVYRLTNSVNGKVYIGIHGKTDDVENRWMAHIKKAKSGSPDVFVVDVLYRAQTDSELRKMETFFIILHQSHVRENGYNQTLGGQGLWSPSEELRARLRLVHTETQSSPAYRARMSAKLAVISAAGLNCCKAKAVRCLSTKEIFASLQNAVDKFGGCTSNLARSIRLGHRYFGKTWAYA